MDHGNEKMSALILLDTIVQRLCSRFRIYSYLLFLNGIALVLMYIFLFKNMFIIVIALQLMLYSVSFYRLSKLNPIVLGL